MQKTPQIARHADPEQSAAMTMHLVLDTDEPGEIRLHAVSDRWLRLTLVPERNADGTEFLRQPVDIADAEQADDEPLAALELDFDLLLRLQSVKEDRRR